VDEPRIASHRGRTAEPESVDSAGREVLHEHVRSRDEFVERMPALVGLQVEHDALLVAVEPHEVARFPADSVVVLPCEVS
jgi:hypothetical protein